MAKLPTEVVRLLDQVIVRSPYGNLLGLELLEAAPDLARVRMPFRPEVTTVGDTVHGGAISALVDVAATAAFWANAVIVPESRGTTIGFSVSFLAAGRGKDLVATASVRRRGRDVSTGEVTVHDTDEMEIAVALVTYKLSAPG